MKKLLALLLSLAMALSLAACGGGETAQQEPGGDAAGETYSFSVGTNTAEDSVNHLLAAKFKELIEDRSDGAVTVTLYENGALGGDAELTESCIFEIRALQSRMNYLLRQIKELEAAMLPQTASEVDLSVINSNFAMEGGMNPATDSLASEDADSEAAQTFANIIAVKEGHENDPAIQALVKALQSDKVKEYIEKTYSGAVVAVF